MQQGSTRPSLDGARVLVIENDPFTAADLDLLVEDAGGEVVALAGSHHDALTLLGREPVDAAIVSPDLPDGGGPSVVAELNRRGIPFVFHEVNGAL
jgi:CheY-like chemotaxis protein